MKKTICLYFQVQPPVLLKRYRFFNMGLDHHYLDDQANRALMQSAAIECYLPMNRLLLELIRQHEGAFRVSLSMPGVAIELFRNFAPDALDGFRALADTGCVEFLGETYAHSIASLASPEEFAEQVEMQRRLIQKEFNLQPQSFRNTELIYSDTIGEQVAGMGFKTMLIEGAKQVLGWKSPNFVYTNPRNEELKLLLRHDKLSDDLSLRFSNKEWNQWPLTAEKYVNWLNQADLPGEVINLFMGYETFGGCNKSGSGIFEFMRHFPDQALEAGLSFATPAQVSLEMNSAATLPVPYPTSWYDQERDVAPWLGNELQNEAFEKLYQLREAVHQLNSPEINHCWYLLQYSHHLYYMGSKWFSDRDSGGHINPYGSPYEAFINYMNILSDFKLELYKRRESVAPRSGSGVYLQSYQLEAILQPD